MVRLRINEIEKEEEKVKHDIKGRKTYIMMRRMLLMAK